MGWKRRAAKLLAVQDHRDSRGATPA
jgi:hypothetical protein